MTQNNINAKEESHDQKIKEYGQILDSFALNHCDYDKDELLYIFNMIDKL